MINFFKYFIYENHNDSKINNPKLRLPNSEFCIISNQNDLEKIFQSVIKKYAKFKHIAKQGQKTYMMYTKGESS